MHKLFLICLMLLTGFSSHAESSRAKAPSLWFSSSKSQETVWAYLEQYKDVLSVEECTSIAKKRKDGTESLQMLFFCHTQLAEKSTREACQNIGYEISGFAYYDDINAVTLMCRKYFNPSPYDQCYIKLQSDEEFRKAYCCDEKGRMYPATRDHGQGGWYYQCN